MGSKRAVAAIVLGGLQVLVFISLALAGPDDLPHGAPIRVVAPPVIATAVVDRANTLAGHPVYAQALRTDADARRSVKSEGSVAAVVIDLRKDTDVVYIAGVNGEDLNDVLVREIEQFERSFGRKLAVRDLVPARDGDADARGVYLLVGVSALLGFVGPIVITWVRGPVAPTLRGGLLRLVIAVGSSVAVGLVAGALAAARYDGDFPTWWAISTLTMLAGATITMALESVLGAVGIGASATLVLFTGAPLVRLTHPLLLPEPWSTITPWLPHGAAIAAGRGQAYFGGVAARPLLILAVWSLIAIMALAVARREREPATSG